MAAPKGNQNALGNNGGRPPIFNNAEELQAKIDEYFDNVPIREVVIGGQTLEIPVVTITGLVLHLGFASRQSMTDYEKHVEYSDIIKRARLKVENDYELQLRTSTAPTGTIFGLKNMGWSDKQNVELTGKDGGPIETEDVSDNDLARRIALTLTKIDDALDDVG